MVLFYYRDTKGLDEPPKYCEIVERKEPPTYLENKFNNEINPQRNKEWAKNIEDNTVSLEVQDALNKSRRASVVSIISSKEGKDGIFLGLPGSQNTRRFSLMLQVEPDEEGSELSYSRRSSFPML